MTVLIAGAGIGGLTLALSLQDKQIPFRIFEAVAEVAPLGVGINLQPHAVRELTEMGLADRLNSLGIRTKEVAYFSRQGGYIWAEPRGRYAGYNWPQYSVHRGKLQLMLLEALKERVGDDVVETGRRVHSSHDFHDGVEVVFADGLRERGQLCIAADGIHSALRAQYVPGEGAPHWGGTIMWRGTTISEPFLSGATMAMAGRKDQKFVVYPIEILPDGRQVINWIADLSKPAEYLWNREDWNRQGQLSDFLPLFADWTFNWLDIPALIRGAETVYEYPMVDRNPLDRWTFGRTGLLGDAAHAMYPIGSNGASQAILDARVLTRCLMDHGTAPAALKEYESIRREAVNRIVLANRGDGPDKILDEVATLAPDGFAQISDVLGEDALADVAGQYKTIAGFDVESLNARPSLVG
ncbi:flavin-dependent oxidoreductase [Neptunicoccus sediminis]|uniref:flavin-dependent oxidoreductase n=1 Tax=Neptunicoccus sediminis TaxID=1892596 RepID=UPI0008462464|nr:flavin-dependent oxidoreductase [Neptunicoccus sediminis]